MIRGEPKPTVGQDLAGGVVQPHRRGRLGLYPGKHTVNVAPLVLMLVLAACRADDDGSPALDRAIENYRERMQAYDAYARPGESGIRTAETGSGTSGGYRLARASGPLGLKESLLAQPSTAPGSQPAPNEILDEIPDPSLAEAVFAERLRRLEGTATEPRVITSYRNVIDAARNYLQLLYRPKQVRLSLAECVERALQSSYAIRVESFNPAISQTFLVEAEAAFDAVFFLDAPFSWRDLPTGIEGTTNQSSTRGVSGGIRKLLPSGMTVETSLGMTRTYFKEDVNTNNPLNPRYDSVFSVEFRQPLLRGFGLDYNRAQINIRRVDQQIAKERFDQRVRETVLNVERAYWRLGQVRRDVMIQAETVAQNAITHESIKQRIGHDATFVELNNSLSRWKQREVSFQEAVRRVRDAEDVLKNLLNDADLKLSHDIEIIPTETLLVAPLAIDQFAEVRVAVDERNEIREARLRIEQARIQSSVSKNETLPQLDLAFTYQVDGLARTPEDSFDNLSTSRYQSYAVGLQFSYPIGNRAAEARLRRAHLQEEQSRVALQQVADGVIQEVNNAVRGLQVGWSQIPIQFDSVRAADRNLRALQARSQRIDPSFLETELNSVDALNNTRSILNSLLTEYNIGIVELESAKGTLLRYNNINVLDAPRRGS